MISIMAEFYKPHEKQKSERSDKIIHEVQWGHFKVGLRLGKKSDRNNEVFSLKQKFFVGTLHHSKNKKEQQRK